MVDRSALQATKLRALVDQRWGPDAARQTTAAFPGAVVLADDTIVWALLDDDAAGLGPALAWSARRTLDARHILVDDPAIAVRRLAAFRAGPQVWQVDGRELTEVSVADPMAGGEVGSDGTGRSEVSDAVARRAVALADAGLDVVFEHGLALGEFGGLEVARVVDGPDGAVLEIGIGAADRQVQVLMERNRPEAERLAEAVDLARRHRSPDSQPHPLGRLVGERWLRTDLIADPTRIDALALEAVEPSTPRTTVAGSMPAAAVGQRTDGSPVVVVCSVGIDLGLVPAAGEIWWREAADESTELVLAVPARDHHPATLELAGRLIAPTTLVAVEGSWTD